MKAAASLALSIMLIAAPTMALSEDAPYPNRSIRIVQPTAAGGPSDVLIRVVAEALQDRMSQPVVVENKPGAGGVIGAQAVLGAPADGYSLLSVGNFLFTTAALRAKMPYDAVKDFTGISLLTRTHMVLVANNDFPPNTLAEVIDLAKKSPTPLLYTSPNFGGVPYLSGQLLMNAAGIKLEHVTYSGSPAALVDVMSGRVPMMFDLWSSARPYVADKRLKVIAVVTGEKLPDAPQYPLMRDMFPVFDFTVNNALAVPSKTPPAVVKKLSDEVHAVMKQPEVLARIRKLGIEPAVSTTDEYNLMAKEEFTKWYDLAKANNITIK